MVVASPLTKFRAPGRQCCGQGQHRPLDSLQWPEHCQESPEHVAVVVEMRTWGHSVTLCLHRVGLGANKGEISLPVLLGPGK